MTKQKLDIASSVVTAGAVHITKEAKELAKDKIKELIQEETVLVKGIFQNFETPGAAATITVRKYPGVPVFTKSMMDGFIYEIPLYVARFINGTDVSAGLLGNPNHKNPMIGTCSYGVHGFKMDDDDLKKGNDAGGIPVPIVGITKRVRRYGFQSTEFGGGL
jgi:hypothetical protein